MTTEAINYVFQTSLEQFYKNFEQEKDGTWKITLDDLEKIKEIDQSAFLRIKIDFINSIKSKNLGLESFYDLFIVGLRLLNTNLDIMKIYWKSRTQEEKEIFFQKDLTEFFVQVLSNNIISLDAYLYGKKHSDCIMFNKDNIKDLVFIEYAADASIGNDYDKDVTILGHLNKIVDRYLKTEIDFFRHSKDSKRGYFLPSQMWFIYFGQMYNLNDTIQTIKNKKYEKINIVLVDYEFIDTNTKHLKVYLKKHDEKNFNDGIRL